MRAGKHGAQWRKRYFLHLATRKKKNDNKSIVPFVSRRIVTDNIRRWRLVINANYLRSAFFRRGPVSYGLKSRLGKIGKGERTAGAHRMGNLYLPSVVTLMGAGATRRDRTAR